MISDPDFTEADLTQLAERGVAEEEARRQLAMLRNPPRPRELVRPCTVGDGVEQIEQDAMPELVHLHEEAARAGRLMKFVPASGAATRMFQELLAFRDAEGTPSQEEIAERAERADATARVVATFLRELPRFAFHEELKETLQRKGRDLARLAEGSGAREILDALLGAEGMGYAQVPKGLIAFHRYEKEVRTPFEEHLVEAAQLVRAGDARCRLHFTISPVDEPRFAAVFDRVRSRHERKRRAKFDVSFSSQEPRTDTLSLGSDGRVFRDGEGRLLFRPGGHGALLANLGRSNGDLVHVKNIDNVPKESLLSRGVLFRKLLVGRLVQLQGERREHAKRLERSDAGAVEGAREFARRRLYTELPVEAGTSEADLRERFLALLRRPLRVCGVVKNAGEPGGAPFWVRDGDGGTSLQIVEGAEVDPGAEEQKGIFASSTHFNPVDMVCGLLDPEGRRIDLAAHLDPDAVIPARKSSGGRELLALERPGLWNGGMGRWSTVFVEIPGALFAPVKTVLDLLRDEHQAG